VPRGRVDQYRLFYTTVMDLFVFLISLVDEVLLQHYYDFYFDPFIETNAKRNNLFSGKARNCRNNNLFRDNC